MYDTIVYFCTYGRCVQSMHECGINSTDYRVRIASVCLLRIDVGGNKFLV